MRVWMQSWRSLEAWGVASTQPLMGWLFNSPLSEQPDSFGGAGGHNLHLAVVGKWLAQWGQLGHMARMGKLWVQLSSAQPGRAQCINALLRSRAAPSHPARKGPQGTVLTATPPGLSQEREAEGM